MKVCLPDENDRSGIFRNEERHQSTLKALHSAEVVVMTEAPGLNLLTRLKTLIFLLERQGEVSSPLFQTRNMIWESYKSTEFPGKGRWGWGTDLILIRTVRYPLGRFIVLICPNQSPSLMQIREKNLTLSNLEFD